ncbi:MAG: metal-dependent hydrolase [Herminiimonas sp.]|nr:metal-dependent hydrolase [Herminiimonas sp.]
MMIRRFAAALAVTLLTGQTGAATAAEAGKVEVQWLGQATAKITTLGGKVIIIDPWLTTNPKTPDAYKKLDALGKVDLILVTHGHNDHFGDVAALAKLTGAPVYGPAGLIQSATSLAILTPEQGTRFGKSGTVTPIGANIRVTATHAEHSSELAWRNPATGKDETHVGGEPQGYIIELENGFRIYHMGDTGLFGDMKLIGEYYHPDLVLIPIGGHFVMDPKDAAYAVRNFIKPKFAIPIHYGTTPQLKGTPEEFIKAMGDAPTKVLTMKPGDKLDF